MSSLSPRMRHCLVVLGMLLVAAGIPAAVHAEGIAYTAHDNQLQRHSLATGSTSTVGAIGSAVAALAFAPSGQLWGMAPSGQLLRINTDTGFGLLQANPFASIDFTPSDMAFGASGDLWVVGQDGQGMTMLYAVDVLIAQASLVGPLSVPVTAVATDGGTLFGLADFQLYAIDTNSGATTLASDAFFSDALAMDFSNAEHLWVLSTTIGVDPPVDFIAGYETQFGDDISPPFEVPNPSHGLAIDRGGNCDGTATEMCLLGGRFRVEVEWGDFQGGSGSGGTVPESSDRSGLFYFFNPDNWEMLVKMLDGCSVNDHFWVFAAQATNVEYTLTVTDTETGQVNRYFNSLGTTPQPITDTAAFATCP